MKMYDEFWINSQMYVWLIREGGPPYWLQFTSVERIQYGKGISKKLEVCPYCRAIVEGNECKKCGAPAVYSFSSRGGGALLHGMLPAACALLSLPEKFSIDILRNRCCDPRNYRKEDVAICMSNCAVNSIKIPQPVARFPDDESVVIVEVEITCDVEVLAQP